VRRLVLSLASVAVAVAAAATATAAESGIRVTPIGRLPFPERGYIVELPRSTSINAERVSVTENGEPVANYALTPVSASGIRYGTVLAVDASESMAGRPIESAVLAARSFLEHRGSNERVGLVTFNGEIRVAVAPTSRAALLERALATTPPLAYGTRIFDAVGESLRQLRRDRIAAGTIVLLSDGADVGSRGSLRRVIADAKTQRVRIFTVGLRSGAYEPSALRALAEETGGRYVETADSARLAAIYRALSQKLANEYLLQYRSLAAPKSHVDVEVSVPGFGRVEHEYIAPTPSALAPYYRPLMSRFLLSPLSLLAVALFGALLVAGIVVGAVARSRSRLADRVGDWVERGAPEAAGEEPARKRRVARISDAGAQQARSWLAKLDHDLDIADIQLPARRYAVYALLATAGASFVLASFSPKLALVGLLTPLIFRGYVKRRLTKVRNAFADQLPPNLQVLASALRAGHSFTGALSVTAENAHEPTRRELRRVMSDDHLGVPMEEAIRRVADRMKCRDLEQVALLAELQRTTGGNAAEVLDVVVGTVRERADIRRLVRTLTAQGRMARWILTAMPVVVAVFGFLIQPDIMWGFVQSTGGQVALVIAAVLVTAGSLMIQKIVDIEV
jgi:tight adherence protein B